MASSNPYIARREAVLTRSRFLSLVNQFRKARLLVVGDFILDQFIWGQVSRISPEAPVPVVQVQRESYMLGGALNVAHNVVTLGGKVFPTGIVGRDFLGRMLLKVMKRNNEDTSGVFYDPDRPTTHKTRVIAHSQQVVRFDREAAKESSPKHLRRIIGHVAKKIKDCDGIVIADYGKGVITRSLMTSVLKLAKKHKKFVLVDPKEKNFPFYKGATIITPNRKEAYGGLAPHSNGKLTVEQVGAKLVKQLKLNAVLVTLGEEGMALIDKERHVFRIPTAAREVFDVSGAGDTVVAVFSLALASGASLQEAAAISNLAAGIVVGKLGTATVTQEELINSFQKGSAA